MSELCFKPATRKGVKPLCSVPNCSRAAKCKGFCIGHYDRTRRFGNALADRPFREVVGSSVRPVNIAGEIAYVRLTKGKFAIIDSADAALVGQYNWHVCHTTEEEGRTCSYAVRRENRKMYYLHRLIMGEPEGFEVDHRDRNGLNDRRANLRIATHSQNGVNRAVPKGKTSQYRGVSIYRPRNIWQAQIKINGQTKGLGHFRDEIEAAVAYDVAAKKAFGEFAQPNFK